MLRRLFIKNYVLIDSLEIRPCKTFNVITGQTGAGKSILLGAMGLLLGDRLDGKVTNGEKCVIEGEFDAYDMEAILLDNELDIEPILTIRREITQQAKSRAFINDTPVTLETLKKITSHLIDIHSQYDTLKLGSNSYQLSVIDGWAQNQALLSSYQAAYRQYVLDKKAFEELLAYQQQILSQSDTDKLFLEEIKKLKLSEWDFEQAEAELSRLENAEAIKTKLHFVAQTLEHQDNSVLAQLKSVQQSLNSISSYSPVYKELTERLNSLRLEFSDLATEVWNQAEKLGYDAQKIELLRSKIDSVNSILLKHKFKQANQLIEFQQELEKRTSQSESLVFDLEQASKKLETSKKTLDDAAKLLSESRKKVADGFCGSLLELLGALGMPQARFEVKFSPTEPGKNGSDAVVFLFSANKGQQLEELSKAASGGEFSRLMLSVKYLLAQKTQLPTLIFDEIDTGISGEIAVKVAAMVKEISRNHQVFVITHQPLMAAGAVTHYVVYKEDTSEKTVSKIKELEPETRLQELAVMIAGANPPASAVQSARQMIKAAQ